MRIKQIPIYKRILKGLDREIQVHPDYADFRNQRGLLMMVKGDLSGAKQEFRKALRLNANYQEATLHLGCLYLETRHWKEAEAVFLPEVKKKPKDGFLQYVMGFVSLQRGRPKEAVLRFYKAIQNHQGYRVLFQKRGAWKNGKIYLDEKVETSLHEIYLHRLYAQFHNFMGLTLAKEGKLTLALQELKKAEKLHSDEFQSHSNLGFVYYCQGALRKAIGEFKKTLQINPRYGMGYAHLSYSYGLMRRTHEAFRYMEKAVRLNPQYADLHYHLALLYSDRKQYEEAMAELKKALRINPNYLFARINLGVLYEDQKRWKDAIKEYKKILRITPEDDHVRKRLEKLLAR